MAAAIAAHDAGKRYVKYEDTPTLIGRIIRPPGRTRRSHLWAIRHATFDVAPGESLGVIGRNGSGKSTLLRLLAGVTSPTEGTVRVRGRVAPLIAVGVGFHPELTGRENVYVNGTVLGLSRRQIDDRFDDIVAFADIGPFLDTPVKFYSSGMFVRLGFSVSVLADPDVLLVDEVLAVGDLAFQLRCFDRMSELQRAGTTIVVVSHNLNAVRNMCRRTLVLHDGDVRYDGETGEAISLYHDLLALPRADALSPGAADEFRIDSAGVIERFDLVGPDGCPTRHLRSTDDAAFYIDVRFARRVDDPIVAFSLFNSGGVQVYGMTTPWRATSSFPAGTTARFTVRLRPALATDSYTAQLVLVGAEGVSHTAVVAPLLFYVGGRPDVQGVADLDARFEVEAVPDG